MSTIVNKLFFPSLRWLTINCWGILGASAFLSLGLLIITIFILFHLHDYKKPTLLTFIFLSLISISFSIYIYISLLKYVPSLAF